MSFKRLSRLSAASLAKRYKLVPMGNASADAISGDLLVYAGHVVILERITKVEGIIVWGDVIHATGGKDLKGPGLGIQRERSARLDYFRGDLLRILRHVKMQDSSTTKLNSKNDTSPARMDLRKLKKIPQSNPRND